MTDLGDDVTFPIKKNLSLHQDKINLDDKNRCHFLPSLGAKTKYIKIGNELLYFGES